MCERYPAPGFTRINTNANGALQNTTLAGSAMITPALLILAGVVSVALSITTTFLVVERSWPKWALVLALIVTIVSTVATILLGAAYVDGITIGGCS